MSFTLNSIFAFETDQQDDFTVDTTGQQTKIKSSDITGLMYLDRLERLHEDQCGRDRAEVEP